MATNTTISREELLTPADQLEAIGAGEFSGPPLREQATEVVRHHIGRADAHPFSIS